MSTDYEASLYAVLSSVLLPLY